MNAFLRIRDTLLNGLALLGALAIFALMIHVAVDVAMRNLSNTPVPATYEIVTNYYMIALAFIPLAWVERRGGMVSVEALEPMLSPRMIRISDMFVALLSTIIYGALTWFTTKTALSNYSAGTFAMAQNTPIPIWPAYFLPPLGFGLAAMVTALRLFTRGREAGK